MLERVHRRVSRCVGLSKVLVATEDMEIVEFCQARGILVEMTGKHVSGTDRVAEISLRERADVFVNVQGDQPLFAPEHMDAVLGVSCGGQRAAVATLVAPLQAHAAARPEVVKVAVARDARALYFSRAGIPHGAADDASGRWRHIGLYAYSASALATFREVGESPLERLERLEQLRFLEAGVPVHVGFTDVVTPSVDTLEDALAVERQIAANERTDE
jgi:3-deoxy-manno-octulosonate cytidylyltransferase (CMP-KDO synthetase)